MYKLLKSHHKSDCSSEICWKKSNKNVSLKHYMNTQVTNIQM